MKALLIAATTATLSLAAVADANAWTRNSTTTGPYGGSVHSSGSGSCSGYNCSSSGTYTGRYGQTATRNSATACNPATQSCTRNSTVTGPNGGQVNRSSTISR
jgi:hypothetical protein